jgi:BirA family biotin operon repressor/biotin-[acetyl-CoA-carboxylase] ligase
LVVLRPDDRSPQTLSLVAGLALVEAIDVAVPAQSLVLKWPNDVLLLGKKLAGILLERSGDRIAVGFGVNLATAPKLADRLTSALHSALAPEAFAPLLAASFARGLEMWRTSATSAVLEAWQKRAHWAGARLTVHVAKNQRITGRFAGLAPDGALQLMLDNGALEVVRAGDVEL